MEPENLKAIAGLARCYLTGGDVERAREVVVMASAEAKDADLAGVRAALALAEQADGETGPLEQRLAARRRRSSRRGWSWRRVLAGTRRLSASASDHLLTIHRQGPHLERGGGAQAARHGFRSCGAGLGGGAGLDDGGCLRSFSHRGAHAQPRHLSSASPICPSLIPGVSAGRSNVLLPRGRLPLNIFEPRYLNMIDDAMASERIIGMIQTITGNGERAQPRLARVGCAGRITGFSETSDGRYLITLGWGVPVRRRPGAARCGALPAGAGGLRRLRRRPE